jgi:hypothetical protein
MHQVFVNGSNAVVMAVRHYLEYEVEMVLDHRQRWVGNRKDPKGEYLT